MSYNYNKKTSATLVITPSTYTRADFHKPSSSILDLTTITKKSTTRFTNTLSCHKYCSFSRGRKGYPWSRTRCFQSGDLSSVQIISSHHQFQCQFRFNVEFSLLPTAMLQKGRNVNCHAHTY